MCRISVPRATTIAHLNYTSIGFITDVYRCTKCQHRSGVVGRPCPVAHAPLSFVRFCVVLQSARDRTLEHTFTHTIFFVRTRSISFRQPNRTGTFGTVRTERRTQTLCHCAEYIGGHSMAKWSINKSQVQKARIVSTGIAMRENNS